VRPQVNNPHRLAGPIQGFPHTRPVFGFRLRDKAPLLEPKNGRNVEFDRFGRFLADKADPRFLAERWLEELAKRRCVWCWNRSIDLLHSLWKIYGERGVAVLSTVGRIRKALEKAGARQGIISLVRYAPLRTPQQLEEVTTMLEMERSLNLRRPYLFKDAGYRIEEEVRFVLGANPMATSKPLGVLIDIDSRALIQRFEVAPRPPEG
jgi:hypothetical protein